MNFQDNNSYSSLILGQQIPYQYSHYSQCPQQPSMNFSQMSQEFQNQSLRMMNPENNRLSQCVAPFSFRGPNLMQSNLVPAYGYQFSQELGDPYNEESMRVEKKKHEILAEAMKIVNECKVEPERLLKTETRLREKLEHLKNLHKRMKEEIQVCLELVAENEKECMGKMIEFRNDEISYLYEEETSELGVGEKQKQGW